MYRKGKAAFLTVLIVSAVIPATIYRCKMKGHPAPSPQFILLSFAYFKTVLGLKQKSCEVSWNYSKQ